MSGRSSFLSLALCALLPLVRAQDSSWQVGQAVNTTSGVLTGTHAANRTDVSLYAGIPYAKPPVGDLRWASPQAYKNTTAYNATSLPAGCAANSLASGGATAALGAAGDSIAGSSGINNLLSVGGIGGTSSEDCLYLNIWTKPQTGEDKKAVLVYLYGGGFQFGTSASAAYNGEHFADEEDVILVSVNYRTNVFGFPGLPGTSSAVQNPGLEDQRLALEWIRDNIEAFHGDVDRITLFGESAGAASTDMYQYVYLDDPIISGGIMESGSARAFFDPVKQNNTADWYKMSEALDCGGNTTSADKSLACLRTKSTDEILKATFIYDPLLAILGVFQPTSDEKVVFSDYEARGKAGKFAKLPYLTGNNNYEAGVFKFLAYNTTPPISDNSWDIFDLLIFTCPSMDAADVRYNAGSPVWRYRYFGEFPNTRLIIHPNSGSYHVSEVPVIFETTESVSGAANTANETIISKYMNKLWADFAKDPESAMSSRDLPQWNPTGKSLIYFGVNNETEPWVVYSNNTDESCAALVSVISQLGGTNALTSDPEGFNAKYGALADGLSGFVGIGDSNHSDAPYGPPPIANVSSVPSSTPSAIPSSTPSAISTSTPIVPLNSTTPPSTATGTGSAPIGTVSTGSIVPPKNSSRPVGTGTGTGGFITSTRPAGSSPTTSPVDSAGYTSPAGGDSAPPYSANSPPASSAGSSSGYGSSAPPVSLPSSSVPPVSLPSPSSSVPPVSIPSDTAPMSLPPTSGSPPPISANSSTPVAPVTGTTSKPLGTGTTSKPLGTGTAPKPTGTGVTYPGTGASSSPVNSPPVQSSSPAISLPGYSAPAFSLPAISLPTISLPGYSAPAQSSAAANSPSGYSAPPPKSSAKSPSSGGYGIFGGLGKVVEADFEEERKQAKALFEKLYKESKQRRSVAAWAARP